MIPRDTYTYTYLIPTNGAGTYSICTTTPTTILGFQFLQDNTASRSKLQCGDNLIYDNFAINTPYIFSNYICDQELKVVKTGNDMAMVIVNYVKRDRFFTPDPYDQIVATGTGQTNISPVITWGDIITGYFLFLLILGGCFGFLIKRFLYNK